MTNINVKEFIEYMKENDSIEFDAYETTLATIKEFLFYLATENRMNVQNDVHPCANDDE